MKKSLRYGFLLIIFSGIILQASCSNKDEYEGFDDSINSSIPNKYFQFFNQQSALPAGHYTIIVATKESNVTADFSLSIKKNDGSEEVIENAAWVNSFGVSATPWDSCFGNNTDSCFNLALDDASGVTIKLTSNVDAVLYFASQHDTPTLLQAQDAGTVNFTEVVEYAAAQIREVAYSQAYYDAVDGQAQRDTLQKYLALHDFDNDDVVRATFRDVNDLGYGRDMYMRSYHSADCGGQQVTAFYVRNFQVNIVEGVDYGEINLDAAINENLNYHFGSNAIEFSKGFDSLGETCADKAYTRFFAYQSDYSSVNAAHKRLDEVDLDGRGDLAMPQPCISCHGGKARPLDRFNRFVTVNANDSANQIGDTKAQLQIFDVNTFQFSRQTGKTKANFEEDLRQLNSAVFCTYPGSFGHAACADFSDGVSEQSDNGDWNGDFVREKILTAYGNKLETKGTAFKEGFVPAGWQPKVGSVPEGADVLFTEVVEPHCIVCHGKQGDALGAERNENMAGKDIDFSSWQKFIGHAEEIQQRVFAEGRMPLGLLNYTEFWRDNTKAQLLATFITPFVEDFSKHLDANKNVLKAGGAVARAGLDRVTKTNAAITLNASSSFFADRYQWTIISQPTPAALNLSGANNAMLEFEAAQEGVYALELTVTNSETGSSDSDQLTILVDDNLVKAPRELTFYDDVKETLVDCAVECHSSDGIASVTPSAEGIPVWWSADVEQPIAVPTSVNETPALGLYEQFRARVNLNDIKESLVLKKPSNVHHFGGITTQNLGFVTTEQVGSANRLAYDLYVNWISEGAICGGTKAQCPAEE